MADNNFPKGVGVPFSFTSKGYPEPATGSDLIGDSVFTILSTTVGERVHRPTFGSFLKRLIFEPVNRITAFRVEAEIRRALSAWEPRVSVENILFDIKTPGIIKVQVFWIVNGSVQGNTIIPLSVGSGA